MDDQLEEISEQEFIDRLRQHNVSASHHQLRHLKRKGEIRGAVQRRVPGRRGSVSAYLASEVDRVVAILAAAVDGRRTVERASRAAWLQQGEAALPAGITSRLYIVSTIEQKRAELAGDARGEEFLELVRDPIDLEADEDGLRSEKGFNLAEELLPSKPQSPELPLIELAVHSMLIRNYAADSDLAEVQSVADVLGVISTPQSNREAWGEDEFRQPVSQIFLNPAEYLADVDDETIELARQTAMRFLESLRAFKDLPRRLERLRQPGGPTAESLATLGALFSGHLEGDPAFAVAYLAKKIATGGEPANQFLRQLDTIEQGLSDYKKVEDLVATDPSILKRLEEFAAAQRKKPS
ncbi:MAG: hypothetical protein WA304_07885 [Candidatus Cybelea sp.]